MNKLFFGAILVLSSLALANSDVITIPESLENKIKAKRPMDVQHVQALVNRAGEIASQECTQQDADALHRIAEDLSAIIDDNLGSELTNKLISVLQKIYNKAAVAKFCRPKPKDRSYDKVRIEYNEGLGVWGYAYFPEQSSSKVRVDVIPVSDKAFNLLASFSKDSAYECALYKATHIIQDPGRARYYVIDMKCE